MEAEKLTSLAIDRTPRRYLWLLLLTAGAMHAPALFQPFFLDDYVYVNKVHDLDWHQAANLFRSSTLDDSASGVWWAPAGILPFYRPIGQLTFAADHCLWGLRPFGYHLTNLLLHLVCITLTWRLALRLFEKPLHALAAAVVFALHPVHSEAVTWISGRFDLLVCVCMLASVLSYLNWRERSTWGWGTLSLLWFIVGLGCKETALILPVMLCGLEIARGSMRLLWNRRIITFMGILGVVSLLYVSVRIRLFGSISGKLPPPYGLDLSSPLIAARQIAWNCAQYLLDVALCIHIEPAFLPQFWSDHPFLFGAALAISGMLVMFIAIQGRSRVAVIGVLWLVLFTAPSLLSMPGERNIYLASVGTALWVGAAFKAWCSPALASSAGRRRRISYAIVGLWLVICVVQQTLMGFVTGAGEKVYRDLQALLPDPPRDARIFIIHQNPLISVGFTQAIRLRYGRTDLSGCALSLSSALNASSVDRVWITGPDSIRLVREGGAFFGSFIERFHRFSEPATGLAEVAHRSGLELLNPPSTYDQMTQLDFRLPYPLDDPRVELFYWDNHRVQRRLDLFRMGSLAELKRCRPEVESTAPATSR